jgi:hypothetical protein
MIEKLLTWARFEYEVRRLYVANPCDADAHKALKPLGYALGLLSVACPCCSAVRMLLALLVGAFAPPWVPLALLAAVALLVAVVYVRWPWREQN